MPCSAGAGTALCYYHLAPLFSQRLCAKLVSKGTTMTKLSIGLFFLLFSTVSIAQEMTCLDKLLPYNRYSGLHQVTKDEWTDGKNTLDPEIVKTAVSFLTNSKLLCRQGEVVIKVYPVCNQTIADLPQSNTCFVYTNLGFFVVSRDNGTNINFIFSKDRRFSEANPEL